MENIIKSLVKFDSNYSSIWNAGKISQAYNYVCYLNNINEPIYVPANNIHKEIIIEVQKELINELATKGIVVEVNKSSNVAIGELDSMFASQSYIINRINN